jgi:hypothetical protein
MYARAPGAAGAAPDREREASDRAIGGEDFTSQRPARRHRVGHHNKLE